MPIKVIIRADASRQIGSGHIMRCAALAQSLRERRAEVTFVCRAHDGNYCDWLEEQGFTVFRLPPAAAGSKQDRRLSHAAWLGVTQARDAEETSAVLEGGQWDWLIVDHYGLDAEWERTMRRRIKVIQGIMAIDDLADRPHDADILLDQNLQSAQDRYLALLPDTCTQLLGPTYALLRPEFARMRAAAAPRGGDLKRLLIFMGGSDPHNITGRVLDGVRQAALAIHTDVVMGAAAAGLESVRLKCAGVPDCSLHVQTADMAQLMAKADLTIGAPGTATWERCCLGLPSLLLAFAENQRELGTQAARRRAAILLGDATNVSVEDIASMLKRLAHRPTLLRHLARRASTVVDGKGAHRVLAALTRTLQITIVSDADSWINSHLPVLVEGWKHDGHKVRQVHDVHEIADGDLAFYLGCGQLASRDVRQRSAHNLVVHESALPRGRGWSPLTWQILEGKAQIPATLLEAADAVDSGPIYLQRDMFFTGRELIDELRTTQAQATFALCRDFVTHYPVVAAHGKPQRGAPSYYPRRRSVDSRLDPSKTMQEQFNLLRVVDNERYPAFFELGGRRYRLAVFDADAEARQ